MLRAVLLAVAFMLGLPRSADGAERWRWPVDGSLVRAFHVRPGDRYAAGQHRGITLAAPSGTPVQAPCGGRVTWAGRVGATGLAVAVGCGRLSATLTHLGAVAVRRGRWVVPGGRIGAVGGRGRVQLGARVRAQPDGYVDPLALLGADPAPPLGPAPPPWSRRRPPPLGGAAPRRVPAPAPAAPPAAAWWLPVGLALLAAGAGFGFARRARRPRSRARPREVVARVEPRR
jgi:Peptidase family M23